MARTLTCPASEQWGETRPGFRRHEERTRLGTGEAVWLRAAHLVMGWEVKRRAGFEVTGPRVRPGDTDLVVRVGPVRVVEPVTVLELVDEPDRVGFAYATRPGHPVSGEEAFVVVRSPTGDVDLVLRSLTRAAPSGVWRPLFPALLVAQRLVRARYRSALLPDR